MKCIRTLSIRHGPMTPAKNAAYDESEKSLHIQLIMAVTVAHEKGEAAPGRHGTQHGTSDSQHLVAHDRMIVQRQHEPPKSFSLLIKAVAAAHEIEEAPPSRHGTSHGMSDSQCLVAHDQVLVQRRREAHKTFSQLIKAVAVAHEIVDAPPSRHGTSHGMSDSQRLVAHDQVLVQRRREHRGLADILSMHRNFERSEISPETSMRWDPSSCQKSIRGTCPGPPLVESHHVLG